MLSHWYYHLHPNLLKLTCQATKKLVSSDPVTQYYQNLAGWLSKAFGRRGKGCLVFHGGILPLLAFLCFNFFLLKWQQSLHVVVVSSLCIYFHLWSARYWTNLRFSSGLQAQ